MWAGANDTVALWQSDAKSIDVDVMLVWVPPPKSGAMQLHYKETEKLELTPDNHGFYAGAVRSGHPQDAVAKWVVAMVGPCGKGDNILDAC